VRARWVLAAAIGAVLATQAGDVPHYIASPGTLSPASKIPRGMRAASSARCHRTRGAPGSRWRSGVGLQRDPDVLPALVRPGSSASSPRTRRPEALRLPGRSRRTVERFAAPPLATVPVGLTPELVRTLLRIVPDTIPAPRSPAPRCAWWPPAVPPPGLAQRLPRGRDLFRRARDPRALHDAPSQVGPGWRTRRCSASRGRGSA
jgi:hypothetical protein